MKTTVKVTFSTEARGVTTGDLIAAFKESSDQGEFSSIYVDGCEIEVSVEDAERTSPLPMSLAPEQEGLHRAQGA